MTPKIKFRGFRADNGKPIYGDLIQSKSGRVMINPIESETLYSHREAVHPESVGMFTGLHDKNGKEIFGAIGEKGGDVIRVYYQMNDMGWVHDLTHDTHIVFREGSFFFNDIDKHARPIHKLDMNFVEVVGNQFEGIREDKKNFVDIYKALEIRDKFEQDNGK